MRILISVFIILSITWSGWMLFAQRSLCLHFFSNCNNVYSRVWRSSLQNFRWNTLVYLTLKNCSIFKVFWKSLKRSLFIWMTQRQFLFTFSRILRKCSMLTVVKRTQLLSSPLQSPDASYLPLECKSVQLMNISLLTHLFCFAYSNIQEWLAIYGNS